MNCIEAFKKNNIQINWATINLGLRGPGKFDRQLSQIEISEFACSLIESDSSQPVEVFLLAGIVEEDTEIVYQHVSTLAGKEFYNPQIELRKWQIILLKSIMSELRQDPLYDLVRLTEFWEKFDYPDYSPHVIQGRKNNISPQNYYTFETLIDILNLHKKWIMDSMKIVNHQSD